MKTPEPKEIRFSTPNTRKVIAGKKTQTRRIIKLPKIEHGSLYQSGVYLRYRGYIFSAEKGYAMETEPLKKHGGPVVPAFYRPKFKKGDTLWIREKARYERMYYPINEGDSLVNNTKPAKIVISYQTDDKQETFDFPERLTGKPKAGEMLPYGIFKEAARYFLEVESVRVENLGEISEEDCYAEGVPKGDKEPLESFKSIWDAVYKDRPFETAADYAVEVINFRLL